MSWYAVEILIQFIFVVSFQKIKKKNMAGPKRDEAKSILSYVRQELRYMDEDLRNDGLLPELSSLRSVYEQLSTLLELSDGRRKNKEKPEFPEDKKNLSK